MSTLQRCYGDGDELMEAYHDTEWGVPVHDDQLLFQKLILDGFQAGLSWRTILHKRENFRRAFDNFDPQVIANYGEPDIERLLSDAGIVRNKLKVRAAVTNAQAYLRIKDELGSFDKYLWSFTGGVTLSNKSMTSWDDLPATSPESDAMSRDLKARGFKFVGSTICYAFMQAVGIVDDHLVGCFRYQA
jgi:DNA-3-methyladenine glycosylase I